MSQMLFKNPLQEEDQLYFIHVPKCAGTSFISLIDEHFIYDQICPVHYDIKKIQNEISDEQLRAFKFIRGHLPYDMIIPRLTKQPRMLTFLREPITRLISNFEMRQRLPDPLVGMQETLKSLTLEQFLDKPELRKHFANRATRLIGGDMRKKGSNEIIPNLERAKERMATFDFVGIVEYFEESLKQFAYAYNFYPIEVKRELNVSPNREKRSTISPETMQRVAEMEYADIELYKLGLELFEKQRERMKTEQSQGLGVVPINYVDRIRVDFSHVNPGSGWHIATRNSVDGLSRWSGEDTHSHLYLPLNKDRDVEVRFQVLSAVRRSQLGELRLKVNGEEVALQRQIAGFGRGHFFRARVPAALLQKSEGETHLTFELKETVTPTPKWWRKGVVDTHLFGLRYKWLEVKPYGA